MNILDRISVEKNSRTAYEKSEKNRGKNIASVVERADVAGTTVVVDSRWRVRKVPFAVGWSPRRPQCAGRSSQYFIEKWFQLGYCISITLHSKSKRNNKLVILISHIVPLRMRLHPWKWMTKKTNFFKKTGLHIHFRTNKQKVSLSVHKLRSFDFAAYDLLTSASARPPPA